MGTFLALLVIAYLVGVFVVARRHYAARHGVVYTRHTPIFNTSTFVGLVWPASLFFEPWKNPPLCQHMRHVEVRRAARVRHESYQQALREEGNA
jgi:hypothetical protein